MLKLARVVTLGLCLSGCIQPAFIRVTSHATDSFNPKTREAVWGRALAQIQSAQWNIQWCAYDSGVIRAQGTDVVPCAGGVKPYGRKGTPWCNASIAAQFTMFDGLATLVTDRGVSGATYGAVSDLVSDSDRDGIASVDASMLATIAGGP